ncbi:hypothetical protein HOY80DRAFT_1054222 [Tuber brumale]|nr:hypothetical protein HOY80DRAFT_1054222 [Tuber brumale]
MPLWGCDYTACLNFAVRGHGDCMLCGRHLCLLHLQLEFHRSPRVNTKEYEAASQEALIKELRALFQTIYINALTMIASKLRVASPAS